MTEQALIDIDRSLRSKLILFLNSNSFIEKERVVNQINRIVNDQFKDRYYDNYTFLTEIFYQLLISIKDNQNGSFWERLYQDSLNQAIIRMLLVKRDRFKR